ncbi:phospholipase A [Denitromonas iodatirespirans]|uniref:Phospholipase A1 n=1 Tax=Denitromonas iodatirespirans TaxID=2795389 RepID=A0A944DFU9_DENI1|nr:phospholipase A [Denitromonas iodatirespirans]MBT0962028.1 phospholipase A [Denitromonas iodatirespirans]
MKFRPIPSWCAAVWLSLAAPVQAERLLSAERVHAQAGQAFAVTVVDTAAAAVLPDEIEAHLALGDRHVAVRLHALDVAAGATRRYAFAWPAEALGLAVVTLADDSRARLMVLAERKGWEIGEDPQARQRALPVEARPAATPAQAPTVAAEVIPPTPALSFYDPMYFVVGANGGASARFQLSFKYRLFDDEGALVGLLPFFGGLHFGYTQTSLWDLGSDSAPFRDTSYRPALFYEWDVPVAADSRHRLWVRSGVEHESNGRDGEKSRSINTAFVQADWQYRLGEGESHFGLTPKLWGYLEKSDNPDIQRYRGYGELGLRFGRDDGWLAKVMLRRGKGGVGTSQVDVSYPLRQSIFSSVGAFFHLQYFDGEGETLLDYRRAGHPQLRIGVSIVR